MARGPLINTTNPSASLMARIRTVKMDPAAALGYMGQLPGMRLDVPALPAPALAPPPALAIADTGSKGGIDSGHLNDEALKAIQKLNASAQQQQLKPEPQRPAVAERGAVITNTE